LVACGGAEATGTPLNLLDIVGTGSAVTLGALEGIASAQGADFGDIFGGDTTFDQIADRVGTILVEGEGTLASMVADGKKLQAEVLLAWKRISTPVIRTPDGGATAAVRG
jgi:hypothetical protein